ncbi:O-succinylbenzoic acid--CoA ligase [Halorhodospira halochloris]|uniref:O-succinylbenzoic acid--CoA ligase n=1 Tax=Halorhodospira halochloris TaxID=1052 RepID=A0A0X8X6Y7_HALHR|nr:o-succinylbenzoate--CoA ligase [Halorhodospira halochloris]MBK1650770.1 o-succinylbenzoate--CoA ligase [Halorhodospira halochloris]MCG5548863.1 o-succinylbenzoate--CoA ligase [Halorhodospira halochloris]BAU56735.1 O-succinylbenzoic acid--CoA ligase [Halorhodospira halochloris]
MSRESAIECRLSRAARLFGNNTALINVTDRLSFSDLDQMVSERARQLQQHGVSEQQWTALRVTTSQQGVIDWLAVLRAGGIALPVGQRTPEAGLQEMLSEHKIGLYIPEPGALPAQSSSIPTAGLASPSEREAALAEQLFFRANTPCAGILTSGSTGRPRVAVHSYANYVRSAQGSQQLIPLVAGDRYLLSLPLNHVGGLAIIMRCLESGATMVLGGRAEDAKFLERHSISHISMVATQLRRLLEQRDIDLPELRCILLGGGPVAETLLEQARQHQLPCYLSYGLTEMASQVLTHDPQGRAHILPYRELTLAADGEIMVRGETLFLGYLRNGEIRSATDHEGWFATRDLGRWLGAGLAIIGRKDNQFISGGENIQPESIELELRRHPAIREAVVVARPDDEYGHRPVAFVDSHNHIPPEEELKAWLRERLAAFLVPDEFLPIPPQEGMKVPRKQLECLAKQSRKRES